MTDKHNPMLYRRLRLVIDVEANLHTSGYAEEGVQSELEAMGALARQPQAVIDAVLLRYVLQELATVDPDDLAELAGVPNSDQASEALLDKVLAVSGVSDDARKAHVDSLLTSLDSFLGMSVRQVASVDAPGDPQIAARTGERRHASMRATARASLVQH